MPHRAVPIVVLACILYGRTPAQDAPARPVFRSTPVVGATDHFGITYLPGRLADGDGQSDAWHDRWLRLNVHVPKNLAGTAPCIIFVHGGGYSGGDKDGHYQGAGGISADLLAAAVARGYVAVNLNYILTDGVGGIWPQVWRDYKNAVRFLRANAAKYGIDPARMAAWGFSAGGWVSSAACFTTADDLHELGRTDGQADWYVRRDRGQKLHVRLDDLDPPHPDQSSRLNAIVADFWSKKHYGHYTADDPAILTYVGAGATHKLVERGRAVDNEAVQLVLTGTQYAGKDSLHVPPLDAACQALTAEESSTIQEQAFAWLDRQLKTDARCTPPEARPNRRIFADRTDVRLVAAGSATIHYTVDGSEPTTASPIYRQPFALTKTTTVKAIAIADGMRASAAAGFTFTKGAPAPRIGGPDSLPPATVGTPWSVTFTTDAGGGLRWNLGGHCTPEAPMHQKGVVKPTLGLLLDPATGTLAGTPTRPGAYTLTIQLARGFGQVADVRDYVLHIRGP